MLDFSHNGRENLFKSALSTGIVLFCGAGFSLLAKDKYGDDLPTGSQMLDELKELFPEIDGYTNLARACTKIKKTDKSRFSEYLDRRFAVFSYDDLYKNLFNISIKSIYTTNIDNLLYKIFSTDSSTRYLHDVSIHGDSYADDDALKYFPLHGQIGAGKECIFGSTEIASAFSKEDSKAVWRSLGIDVAENPVLFWGGWNFEDAGPLEAMFGNGRGTSTDDNTKKWALLYEPSDETIDYISTLGFNVIIGDTESLLKYMGSIMRLPVESDSIIESINSNLFKKYEPPKPENIANYPLEKYFLEYTARWSHIYSHEIPKTSNYRTLEDEISSGKDIVVTGIRGSGKTTLMMQLIVNYHTKRYKHMMVAPSKEQAMHYIKLLGQKKSIMFVDDCFRDTEALLVFFRAPNVQLICFDRDYNYERQYLNIEKQDFIPMDVTTINKEDAQSILSIIPTSIQKPSARTTNFEKDPTILNLLAANLRATNFKFVNDFYSKDPEAALVFIMISYVHSCGIPCSFDMIYSFLGSGNYQYSEMQNIIARVGGLIQDAMNSIYNFGFIDSLQDYYQCRSRFLAEKIIRSIKRDEIFGKVLMRFADNVMPYKICCYDKFKRSGYDADLAFPAFPNVKDGEKYYNLCAESDDSEYIYQQAAIYFSRLGEYQKVFAWIEKARNLSYYNHFSIDSTYAQIYFDVNKEADGKEAAEALKQLDRCCTDDKRKYIHLEKFANCCIQFFKLHGCDMHDVAVEYVNKAIAHIENGVDDNNLSLTPKKKKELQKLRSYLLKCT